MTWDACAARYDNAEDMLADYRERARRAIAATTRPVVIKPLPDHAEFEPSTFVNSGASNGDLTCGNWGQGRDLAVQLRSFPRAYRNIRVRRMVRLICAMHNVEPDQLIDTLRVPREAGPAFRLLVISLIRKGLNATHVGRVLHRDPRSIDYQVSKYLHQVEMRDRERRAQNSILSPKASRILSEVAQKHCVSVRDIKGHGRIKILIVARQEAMWRLRQETAYSFPQIAERLGGRDHATVFHGVRAHQARIDAGEA